MFALEHHVRKILCLYDPVDLLICKDRLNSITRLCIGTILFYPDCPITITCERIAYSRS